MDELVTKWKALSVFGKVLSILSLPLLLLLGFLKIAGSVSGALNDKSRMETDQKSGQLDAEKAKTDESIAHEEGKTDQLELDKGKAAENAAQENPADFVNNRYNPDHK